MKKTIISTAFATASLFLIMGFTDNPQHNLVLSGENLVENLTDEQVTFVEKVSSNDVDYAGLYLYTDGNYNYYVDVVMIIIFHQYCQLVIFRMIFQL